MQGMEYRGWGVGCGVRDVRWGYGVGMGSGVGYGVWGVLGWLRIGWWAVLSPIHCPCVPSTAWPHNPPHNSPHIPTP